MPGIASDAKKGLPSAAPKSSMKALLLHRERYYGQRFINEVSPKKVAAFIAVMLFASVPRTVKFAVPVVNAKRSMLSVSVQVPIGTPLPFNTSLLPWNVMVSAQLPLSVHLPTTNAGVGVNVGTAVVVLLDPALAEEPDVPAQR